MVERRRDLTHWKSVSGGSGGRSSEGCEGGALQAKRRARVKHSRV